MSETISNTFKINFDDECKLVYQDKGGRLKNVVRSVATTGMEHVFQRLGTGEALGKARGAQIPRLNLDHNAPKAILEKRYASEALDNLDRYVQSYDELKKLSETLTMALGRAEDTLIKTKMYQSVMQSSNIIEDEGKGWTKVKAKKLHRHFGQNHIFDSASGRNIVFVSSAGFEDLLDIDSFSNADYMGADELPFKMSGLQGKTWLGLEWYTWDSLKQEGDITFNLAFNSECVGYAHAVDIITDVYENKDTDETVASAKTFGGAADIDPAGIVVVKTKEAELVEE